MKGPDVFPPLTFLALGLLFFLHLIMVAITVQTASYDNDLTDLNSCSKSKCHRLFGPINHFPCLEADDSNSRNNMLFLLPHRKLVATVKEKLMQKFKVS